MTFRQRLVFFLVTTLIGVQVFTAIVAYGVVRHNATEQGRRELVTTTAIFMRQLSVLSDRVSGDVAVLSFDYALRKAVAEHDTYTVHSVLRNHGRRIGATRMLLIGLDGKISADTVQADRIGTDFPFPELLNESAMNDTGTALAALDDGIYWIVVMPVLAPVPIAFIAAGIPVDSALLDELRGLSATPHSLALATIGADGTWRVVSQSGGTPPRLPALNDLPEEGAILVAETDGDNLAMIARLTAATNSQPIVAILDYPLAEVLAIYRAVITPMLIVLAVALAVTLMGAMLIARSVSRPLEALAGAARRIASGDYTPPDINRTDEIGALSNAFADMTQSIAERETALVSAVSSLEVARNEAVRASEAKSQFLSNMSHELRTPLNAIIGFSQMLSSQVLGPLSPRYAEYACNIHDSGQHLLAQVNEMLDLAETTEGKMVLTRERIELGTTLRAILEVLDPDAARKGVRITLRDDPECWPAIEGDARKLRQGLKNLIHNAIKFTSRDGEVTISGTIGGDSLQICIADTGIGMTAEDIQLAVLPFHRRKKAFDGTHQGVGIGLPYAKAILELHGGKLEIESAPGEGTTVTVILPLLQTVDHAA